jgi:hypothetical protein
MTASDAFLRDPKAMVIGTRTFGKGTPLRSLVGNVATRYVFRVATGISVSGTQSGLRCIPRFAIKEFIGLDGERYEYEMNMLISMKNQSLP